MAVSDPAASAEQSLRELSAPKWYDRFDAMGAPSSRVTPADRYADLERARPVITAAKAHLKGYGLKPVLAGSLPMGLNVPGDVDVDFAVAMRDQDQYQNVLSALQQDTRFIPSAHNKPNTTHNVYTAPKGAFGDYPVDVAVSIGESARASLNAQRLRAGRAKALPPELAAAISRKKSLVRNTPFDIGGMRYKALKRDIESALEGAESPTRIRREKLARVLDMSNQDDAKHLDALLAQPDVYGHRTAHADTILESGTLMSGLQALSKGKLKGYESGFLPGLRGNLEVPKLTRQQLDTLSAAWLKDKPDYAVVDSLGHSRDALKGALIQNRLKAVNQHLDAKSPEEAESWRREHLRISKLSPHIFLTGQGLTADKGYGDVGFLFRDKRPTSSPFVTLIQNEAVLGPTKSLHMRGVDLRKALVVAPKEKIDVLAAKHPGYDYVDEEALRERGKLLSTYDAAGAGERLLGHAMDGTLKVLQG